MNSVLCNSLLTGITRRSWMLWIVAIGLMFLALFTTKSWGNVTDVSSELNWPTATQQNRLWTRWWWLGSAVDKANLTRLLSQYREAGLGGVEICPVYGVKGYEGQFINFLSPKWIQMLEHTTETAGQLGLGVDMTTGTGWPFGGPSVSNKTASCQVILKCYDLAGGQKLTSKLPEGQLQCLLAVSDKGQRMDISAQVNQDRLNWTAPQGQWRLYAVALKSPIQKVKRAAPGGKGYVLDPYSVSALNQYLAKFDKAFADYQGKMPRCHFHDSFEYKEATWTRDFFSEFESRRGYDLRTHLEALFGEGPEETVARVLSDYRQTISDLHLTYIQRWTQWCHNHGSLSRNQAHGAPANLVDLYAAADIPETEIFGEVNENNIPMLKFAASAAHLKAGTLVSSESFTWLREHFQTSLAEVKTVTDLLFLAGVNHIFFHGIPYSPTDAPWPGWQFYASVNFGPTGGLWHDLPSYNAYVTRCQSVLQSGKADNDVLLYLPIYDFWQKAGELSMPFSVHNQDKWLKQSSFYKAAMTMWNRGYAFDAVSDQFLTKARCDDNKVLLGGNDYQAIVIPHCRLMPIATMEKLMDLTHRGATIIFQQSLPVDVPGMAELEKRRAALREILSRITLSKDTKTKVRQTSLGKGRLMVGQLEATLQEAGICRESVVDLGVRFVRRNYSEGRHYFLANRSDRALNGWVTLGLPAQSVVIMDPLFDNRVGLAALRKQADGRTQVYLQLQPGQSCILRTFTQQRVNGRPWKYFEKDGSARTIDGTWKVKFVDGGPVLPSDFESHQLHSWTALDDPKAKRFAGTARYIIEFDHPSLDADDWLLDLGRVCESARLTLNGQYLGTLWCGPFQLRVGEPLQPGKNTLQVEVTNLAANRVRDLDCRNVNWKYFYDINIVNQDYKPLNASNWPLRDSGLLGPVRLQPLKRIDVSESNGGKVKK
jgi:hypothetical protein